MWAHDEVDLTPEPWHTPSVPGLEDASEDQTEYWNAPSGEEALAQTGLARWLWAMGYRYGPIDAA